MRHGKLCFLTICFVGAMLSATREISGVEGTATIGRSPFAGVEVVASSARAGEFWETTTDNSGHYLLGELPPGPYTMWAEVTGHGCIVIGGVVVRNGLLARRNFHFVRGKTYPGCESLKRKTRG